jgi:hypothetical protein
MMGTTNLIETLLGEVELDPERHQGDCIDCLWTAIV